MSWLSNLIYGKDPGPLPSAGTFAGTLAQQGKDAGSIDKAYQDKALNYDPGAAFNQYAQGAMGQFKTTLGQSLKELTGKDVGAGRLDTGFFDEDQGQVIRNVSSDFSDKLNQHALDAASLTQHSIDSLGQYAENKQGNYLDLLSGQLDREQGDQNAKRKQRGDFVNGLLGAAGTAVAAFA